MIWVFATNSDILIILSLQPNVANLWYFKLLIVLDQLIKVWNIIGLHNRIAKIKLIEFLTLWQRLNSFMKHSKNVCAIEHFNSFNKRIKENVIKYKISILRGIYFSLTWNVGFIYKQNVKKIINCFGEQWLCFFKGTKKYLMIWHGDASVDKTESQKEIVNT